MKRRVVLRFSWGVADQAVSSLENFILGMFVARTLGAAGLGALAVALVVYALVVNVSRGMSSDPLMVRFSGPTDERWRQAVGPAVGTAFCVGVAFAPVCWVAGLLLLHWGGTEVGTALVVLGLLLPGLTAQDCWRYVFFSAGRGHQAFVNDAVWTGLLILALLAGSTTGLGHGIGWAVAVFGGTAWLAAAFGVLQARVLPRPSRSRPWIRRHRDLATRFVFANLTAGIGWQGRPFIVAAVAGLAAAGAIRGGQMLVGPALAILMGIAQVAVPEAVRALRAGQHAFWRLCVAVSGTLGVLSALWGVLAMLIFPRGLGVVVLGDVWTATQDLLLPIVIGATAGCLHIGPSAGLRALERADLALRVQLVATALSIGSCAVGAVGWGASGAVWGTAGASLVSAVVWWACLRRAMAGHVRRSQRESSGRPRIVIATLMREHGASGVQTHMCAVRDELRAQGVSSAIVTPFSGRAWTRVPVFAGRYAVCRLGCNVGMWWYLKWHEHYLARALRRDLSAAGGPVVVYAQCPRSAAVALRVRTREPVVLVTHFNISQADEWADQGEITRDGALFRSVRREEDRVLAEVDALVHVSAFNQALLENRVPATRGIPQAVIPNFIEPRPLAPSPVKGDLVTVGGLEARKNHQYLVEVVAAAAERGRRYSLVIIGEGPERPALEALARRRGVSDLVSFLGYQVDPRRLMTGHRLYCHASRMESFGISLLEAMDAGLPVAAASVGGVPEVVREGEEGFFWPLDRPATGAERLIAVLEDEETRSAMAKRARERLLTTFSTRQVAPRLVRFLCDRATVEMAGAASMPTRTAGTPRGALRPRRRWPSAAPTPSPRRPSPPAAPLPGPTATSVSSPSASGGGLQGR